MSHIGVFVLPDNSMTNSDGISYVKSIGLAAFEPAPGGELLHPDYEIAKMLRDKALQEEVVLPCFSAFANISGENRYEEVERLKQYIEIAAIMNIPLFHHTIAPELDSSKISQPFEQILNIAVPLVHELYDYAMERNVRCVYENQGYYFNGFRNFKMFLDAVERPVGLVMDMGNIAFALENIDCFARDFAHRVVHVHVKDYKLQENAVESAYKLPNGKFLASAILGEGHIFIEKALKELKKHDYQGYYMIEHSPINDGFVEQKQCIDNLRSMLSKINDE